ncbi:MAG: response regulator, partial [Deltaproteobacteria bacterium]|nr:response regulator [Deltaproteobacteria bacterium]
MERKRILVVDDEEPFVRFVKTALEKTGVYEVCAETVAGQALETARTFRPNFIFMDVAMPGLDGGDVVAQIRAIPALKGVPVVFLTGTASKNEVGEQGGMIGGREFLAKPVTVMDLITTVARHIGPGSA